MPNITPYTNFHELNLDWVLQKMKELEDKVNAIIGSAVPSNDPPVMDGVASAGSSVNYARGDHVHPTDTSRASASALSALSGHVDDVELALQIDINDVDAKIAFTSAAPIVDGVASPGSSAYQARADHVHPTDTSRASQTQVDTIQSALDAFAGSALPYGLTPEMDGEGSAGSLDAYSRGNHVHPSDTSKFDKAGGTITGNTEIQGVLTQDKKEAHGSTSAIGWIRAINVPMVDGTTVNIHVQRSDANDSETHKIVLDINDGTAIFHDEISNSSNQIVDKIRYSDAGKVDVHIDQVTASDLAVFADGFAPAAEDTANIYVESSLDIVDDAPAGEILNPVYNLSANKDPQEFVVEEKASSQLTVLANASGNVSINAAKTGYTPIGIVGIRGTNTADLSYYNFFVDGTSAKVYYKNLSAVDKSYVIIKAVVLYRKN